MKENNTPVSVEVEEETGSLGPLVAHNPEHHVAVQFIESIAGINKEEAKGGVSVMGVPSLVGSVDGTLNACWD